LHDFVVPDLGKAIPYRIYDVERNLGWVSVGQDHDTATFAVESLRRWWQGNGASAYPDAEVKNRSSASESNSAGNPDSCSRTASVRNRTGIRRPYAEHQRPCPLADRVGF
jgi:hypothetical protein